MEILARDDDEDNPRLYLGSRRLHLAMPCRNYLPAADTQAPGEVRLLRSLRELRYCVTVFLDLCTLANLECDIELLESIFILSRGNVEFG